MKYTLENTASETGLSIKTVYEYFGFYREVCYVVVTNETTAIVGENKVVEIDEFHLRTRKFGKGRFLRKEYEHICVFGRIERGSKKCFIV